jgi:hypothetical protein
MTLLEYLRQMPTETTDVLPRSDWTVPMLWALVQGSSVTRFGAAAKEALLGCHRFLSELGRTATDPELVSDVEFHLAVVTLALKRTCGVDVETRRRVP